MPKIWRLIPLLVSAKPDLAPFSGFQYLLNMALCANMLRAYLRSCALRWCRMLGNWAPRSTARGLRGLQAAASITSCSLVVLVRQQTARGDANDK